MGPVVFLDFLGSSFDIWDPLYFFRVGFFKMLGVPTVPDMEAVQLRTWDPKRQILRWLATVSICNKSTYSDKNKYFSIAI
jgi:hypothetical protein